MNKRILVVDDELPIRTMLRYALEAANFDVCDAEDAEKAKLFLRQGNIDLMLLDWMLPGKSGVEFIKQLKIDESFNHIPVILLTARAQEENKITGLNAGADDYVVKPFSPRELIARIHAVLRRGSISDNHGEICIQDMVIDLDAQQVRYRGEGVKFGPLEFRLLAFFVTHADRVYSRDDLLNKVWGSDAFLDERTVDVHIRRLRKRLATMGYDGLVQTVHGSGYRFSEKLAK